METNPEDKAESSVPNTAEEINDELNSDLLQIMMKDITEMTDEELHLSIAKIRTMRKVRIARTKQKTALDIMLGNLSPEKARIILEKMDAFKKVADANANAKANAATNEIAIASSDTDTEAKAKAI